MHALGDAGRSRKTDAYSRHNLELPYVVRSSKSSYHVVVAIRVFFSLVSAVAERKFPYVDRNIR